MEALMIIVICLVVLAGPAALILGIITHRRVGRMQRAFAASPPSPAPEVSTPRPAPEELPRSSIPPPPPRHRPEMTVGMAEKLQTVQHGPPQPPQPGSRRDEPPTRDLEAILGGQWLTWVGVLALFFGTAFFVGVDLGTNALAGAPQLGIGFAVAVAFIVVGRIWSRSEDLGFLGQGLLGGGIALLFLVAYASYGIHHLVPLTAVFPLLLVVAVAGAMLALDRNSLTVASLTLSGALLTPLLLPDLRDPTYALLPYLVAVNLGAVLTGKRRGWAGLPLAAFVGTVILIVDWHEQHFIPDHRVFAGIFVGASWLVFALAPRLGGLRQPLKAPEFWSLARGVLTTANGFLFGLFIYTLLAPDLARYQGLALGILAVVYLVLSRPLGQGLGQGSGLRVNFYTGVGLAVVAIPVQFDLSWITLGWTAIATVLLIYGVRAPDPAHRLAGLAVLAIALFRVIALDLPLGEDQLEGFHFMLNGGFVSAMILSGVVGWLVWAYRRGNFELTELESSLITPLALLCASVLWWRLSLELLAQVNLHELGAGVENLPLRFATLSIFWMLYAAACWAVGYATRLPSLRYFGLGLLALTTLKLLFLDSTTGRGLALGMQPFLNLPFGTGLFLVLVLGAFAWTLRRRRTELSPRESQLPTPILLSAVVVLIWVITAEIQHLFAYREQLGIPGSQRQNLLSLSLVWALYSCSVIAAGFFARFKALRVLGISLLAITILKVFVVDLWGLEKGYRIAAFIGLGVLVLAVSLLYQKRRPRETQPPA